MMPGVLTRYIGRRFLATLVLILAAVFLVVFLADYVEQVRRFSDAEGFTPAIGLQLGLMRAPFLLDTVLPFAFLFASLLSLLSLSRKLELVVARASGISAWGFLAAPFGLAIGLGLLSILVLNPIAVRLNNDAEALGASLSGSDRPQGSGLWFRQNGADGASIVHGGQSSPDGLTLYGVSVFIFEADGTFRQKVTAPRADYTPGKWTLENATVRSATTPPRTVDSFVLPTTLTSSEARQATARPDALSLWALPEFISTANRTGRGTDRFVLAFHTLLARPLFLLAMVTIAATVSLRLSRYGGTWWLVLTGVCAGFLLYVLTDIVFDLGGNGIINPVLASWSPSIIALTFGATALLYQEDG